MRAIDVVRKVAPHAQPNYLAAFEAGDGLLRAAGITTPLRLAHFLAQTLEETGGYVIFVESGNYNAARMCQVWPSRFHTDAEAEPYAHNAEKLFDHVYANRMGNGPAESGDGYRYRGRGILQTTGRDAYRKYGTRCGVDFEGNPDLIYAAEHALKPALAEWADSGCNALADQDNIREITHRVNGGYTNIAERERWLGVVKPLIKGVEFKDGAVAPSAPATVTLPRAPSKPVIIATGATAGTAVAVHHRAFNWLPAISTPEHPMLIAIDLVLAMIVVYVLIDLVQSYWSATGSVWQKLLTVGKQSATVLWARFTVLVTGLAGGLAWACDLANAPGVGTAIQAAMKPQYVAALTVAIALVTELARRRTLPPSA